MASESHFVPVGSFGKIKGLNGQIRLYIDPSVPDHLQLLYVHEGGAYVPVHLQSFSILPKFAVCKFSEHVNLDELQSWVGKRVYLPEKELRISSSYKDLVGFKVSDVLQGELGVIGRVDAYPMQYIASVTFRGAELLVPLNDHFIKEVDTEKKLLLVSLPTGLVESSS